MSNSTVFSPGVTITSAWLNDVNTFVFSGAGPGGGVSSFNTRTGVVTLQPGDVSSALGYIPASIDSPNFTGNPTAPTQSQGNSTGLIASTAFVTTGLTGKQATLVSGTNIKTVNGSTLLGSGDLVISTGGSTYTPVASIASLRSATSGTLASTTCTVAGWYANTTIGGGNFQVVASDTTSVDNGGTIIVDASSRRWYRIFKDVVSVADFGAKGDGTTDDTTALTNAVQAFGSAGGTVVIPSVRDNIGSPFKLLMTSSVTTNNNITIKGVHEFQGAPSYHSATPGTPAPYGQVGSAILINSGATLTLGPNSGVTGLLIYRAGMTFPASNSSAFAGTAITIAGEDCYIWHCLIMGFNQAVFSTYNQRIRIEYLWMDNNNGIWIDHCQDISRITNCHAWPFATIEAATSTNPARSGTAYKFTNIGDANQMTNCFSYAYQTGFIVDQCNVVLLQGCGADGLPSPYTISGSIGFYINSSAGGGSNDNNLNNCLSYANETGLKISTVAGLHTNVSNFQCGGGSADCVYISSGDVTILGGALQGGTNGVTVTSASSLVTIDAVRFDTQSNYPVNPTVSTSKIYIDNNCQYNSSGTYGQVTSSSTVSNLVVGVGVISTNTLQIPFMGTQVSVPAGAINSAAWGWVGRVVNLYFVGSNTVTSSTGLINRIYLAGGVNATFASGDTLTLGHNGTQWYELGRATAAAGGSGTVTNVATGTGLTGGPITSTGTISIATTGVSATSYGNASNVANFTVNAQGQLTSAGNTSISISKSQINDFTSSTTVFNTVRSTNGGWESFNGSSWVGAFSTAAYHVWAGGSTSSPTEGMRLDTNNYLLVGYVSSNGAYKLQVNSQIFATNATIATSDAKYKKIAGPITGALDRICALSPVYGTWKKHKVHDFTKGNDTFITAQDVQKVYADVPYLENLVKANKLETGYDKHGKKVHDSEEFLGVSYSAFIPELMAAVRELREEVAQLKKD